MTTIAPTTLIEHVRARLRVTRHQACVVEDPSLKLGEIGPCQACDTDEPHNAHVVVNTAFQTDEYHYPIWRLDGWSVRCCWKGLCTYIAEQERVEMFEGITVEVPPT